MAAWDDEAMTVAYRERIGQSKCQRGSMQYPLRFDVTERATAHERAGAAQSSADVSPTLMLRRNAQRPFYERLMFSVDPAQGCPLAR